jgi:hypothetical protein
MVAAILDFAEAQCRLGNDVEGSSRTSGPARFNSFPTAGYKVATR